MTPPTFHVLDLVAAVPDFVRTCPSDVIAGAACLAFILLIRRVGTSDNGGAGRMFW